MHTHTLTGRAAVLGAGDWNYGALLWSNQAESFGESATPAYLVVLRHRTGKVDGLVQHIVFDCRHLDADLRLVLGVSAFDHVGGGYGYVLLEVQSGRIIQ
jgi:hypothetical protein